MATKIEDLPEHSEAHARYVGAKAEAAAAKDELGQLRAENEWLQKQGELRDLASQRDEAATAREAALTQIKTEYASVPETLYAHAHLTVEQMVEIAKKAHEDLQAAIGQQQQADPSAGNSSWGTPPAGTPTNQNTQYQDRWADPSFRMEMRSKAKGGDREAVTTVKRAALGQILDGTQLGQYRTKAPK